MAVEDLFARWRLVNQQASDAERRIFEATLDYLRGAGPPPSERDRVIVSQLRSEARTLFARALAQVDANADAARRGISQWPPAEQSSGPRG